MKEFEVLYRPRTAIKGQALANFLVEFTYPEDMDEEVTPPDLPLDLQLAILTSVVYIDGSSNKQGSRAGIILTTPEGIQLEYTLRFRFQVSNNEAEYKALLVGLQLAT